MKLVLIFVLLVVLLFLIITKVINVRELFIKEPCSDKLSDKEYLLHMIPHHQVAVDMSKVLLKNTSNDFMIYLAYRIIRSQQNEIIILNDLLNKSKYVHSSNLIV
jgi:biopolymer transport protein ExbD